MCKGEDFYKMAEELNAETKESADTYSIRKLPQPSPGRERRRLWLAASDGDIATAQPIPI
jgi:hypothetical protein